MCLSVDIKRKSVVHVTQAPLYDTNGDPVINGLFDPRMGVIDNGKICPTDELDNRSFAQRLLAGEYGLAITYWALFFFGCGLYFIFGSRAVDSEQWILYLVMVAAQLGYTGLLLVGIRAAYKGPQLWKVMSRSSSIFMIINILVGISTLGFIY